jgi:hypothetical protein
MLKPEKIKDTLTLCVGSPSPHSIPGYNDLTPGCAPNKEKGGVKRGGGSG